ncbi:hypothetical protein GCM10007216_12670 [Thalassobacillus devorans]|uniref:N-formylglutamate amidohydrolase n=1 Tax=Thalassobacillus devorans TaxID=279813 RepID=A0ABQ1NRA8_9BACI|nr:hypothetical protein [Thalassobacillus devorans]NIK28791.1 hypothetical protein [Thalassobacillus devorans]GGC83509.1 hypothetical protein GCM10007216_12670 [Thalassobacillus devorans]
MTLITTEQIKLIEKRFINENLTETTHFEEKAGTAPIIISAPHSVPQLRERSIKQGEFRTGVLSILLKEHLGCFSIYKTRNNGDDANFDEKCEYKEALIETIRQNHIELLIDLHIMSPKREADIELGTGRGENISHNTYLIERCINSFKENDIENIIVDENFPASYPHTVSATIARECSIPCIQIEMNWRVLDTENGMESFLNVYNSLAAIVRSIEGEQA